MYEDAAVGAAEVGNAATGNLEVLQISFTFDEVKVTAFENRAFLVIVHKLEYEAYSHTVCQISCSSSLDPTYTVIVGISLLAAIATHVVILAFVGLKDSNLAFRCAGYLDKVGYSLCLNLF